MELISLVIVALISISPVGEELIAIPAGVVMGLPVYIVTAVALAANFLPVPFIFFVFDQGNKYPKIQSWLRKRRNNNVKKWMEKYGVLGLLIFTPWMGVYATAITCELMGMQRFRVCAAVAASLTFYAVIAAFLITLGINLR
ncbi:MAG: small multi-drug export protein [Candidatus Methanoperedens sp.]|nr:small multi-drug export protein [Candidatus Methanoperedens sp.]